MLAIQSGPGESSEKRSVLVVNEHCIRFALRCAAGLKHVQPKGWELVSNNALTTQVIIQRFLNHKPSRCPGHLVT